MVKLTKKSTGIPCLDNLIGGGLETCIIIQFYGEPAAGKSTAAMASAIATLRNGEDVIYIDTEGFSIDRFCQLAGDDAESLAERLILFEPADFTGQDHAIAECARLLADRANIGLIVLDSATALYRTENGPSGEAQKRLARELIMLLGYARRYDIPVIVTNQVFTDINTDRLRGLGGTNMHHISKIIVRFERNDTKRHAILEKHRSRPEGTKITFAIEEKGFREE
ncbi:DNA repair and recombination protein RadB [Methanogenium sp. S4BF]|uniref:DNA repair and recombination protein RadB n=1 Tax=Methanogenium sp. S4BF TaxID=1789226 RepID=UPI00241699F3|nr:DNA repair and recombination protein RadB [Methanogenium sp. S4BF]WFN34681.1 DNA repair and recombination protein RadB [Methanogenium sp. S4BF]